MKELKGKVIPNKTYAANGYIRKLLDSIYQGVKRILVLPYYNTNGITPRTEIKSFNIEIDGRSFYDQPINDLIKQYGEVGKVSTGQGDDDTTGCLLDFAYFEKKYKLIAADLSKQIALGADSRAIQKIIFTGTASAAVIIYHILEQPKETILEFPKGRTKFLLLI